MLIFQKMLTLFLLMGVGYFMHLKGWLTDGNSNLLSKIVINIANPAMIISAGMDSATTLSNGILIGTLVFAIAYYAVMLITAPLIVRILRVPEGSRGAYRCMYVFGNIGFMGIPLITSVYGSEYALLIAIYNLLFLILFYSYGIVQNQKDAQIRSGSQDAQEKTGGHWKQVINAGTVGCVIAVVCFLSKIPFPDFVTGTFDMLSNLCAPLSMFVIGNSLASMKPKELISDLRLNVFILLRLFVIPVIAVGLVSLLQPEDLLFRTFYVIISVPIASTCVLVAEEYGGNKELAARGVALSTVVSVISLPLVGMLFGM